MTCTVFEGAAGSGKTYHLLKCAREALQQAPLGAGQRVLATTFMHGARRKLDGALRGIQGLSGRYECATLDSIAYRWTHRWRSLCEQLGHTATHNGQFDDTCDLAAKLCDVDDVARWASTAFPIVLIDEAQDLNPGRLAIVRALAKHSKVFVAGDEFQCLQEKLRPNPFQQWASSQGVQALTTVRRTNEAELLDAAAALRAGGAPTSGRRFKICDTHSAALAGAYLVNALARPSKGTAAVITAAMDGFATDAVEWARRNRSSTGLGPVSIAWETGDNEDGAELLAALPLTGDPVPVHAAISAISQLPSKAVAAYVGNWAETQRNALGRSMLARNEIEQAILRGIANRRRHSWQSSERLAAMTVYAAKNREFDGVIILWPGRVGGSADQKRRLLYNAVTRARHWALVLVQSKKLRAAPPFT